MKRMKRIALAVFLMVGMFFVVSTTEASAQAAQDFTLVNKTGVEINALYVTPHNADAWGEDILGADTLVSGETLTSVFPEKSAPSSGIYASKTRTATSSNGKI